MDKGLAFGAGCLQNFGINSNTSANGFIKSLYKKVVPINAVTVVSATQNSKLKNIKAGLDEEDSDDDF